MDKPGLEPPKGQTSNFNDPLTLFSIEIAVSVVSLTIMTSFVLARLYTKAFIVKEMHWEDYFSAFAMVGIIVWNVLYDITCAHGVSRHQWDVRATDLAYILNMLNIIETIYGPIMFAAKFSVVLQIRRIFLTGQQKGSFYWAVMFTGGIIVGYYLSSFFTFIFQCIPRPAIWDTSINGRCIDPKTATFSAGIANLLTDMMLLSLPMWAIWNIQMPVRRKLAIGAIFATGLFGCAMGAAGIAYRVPLVESQDFTYNIGIVGLWAMAEYTAVIIVGCMPALPLLFKTVTGRAPPRTTPTASYFSRARLGASKSGKGRGVLDSNAKYLGRDREGEYLELGEHGAEMGKVGNAAKGFERVEEV